MANKKYKQGKDGYYRTMAWDGTYNADGSKHMKCLFSKKSSADLERKVNDLKKKVETRQVVQKTDLTVSEYAVAWFETFYGKGEINTQAMYKNVLNVHLEPIWDVKLADITHQSVMLVLGKASGKTRIQEQILMTLKQIVKSAIRDHYLPAAAYNDLFDGIKIKKSKKENRPLTKEEKDSVFKADFDMMDKAFVYIIYGCGLRRGEALALSRFDLNFEKGEITVNKAIVFDKNNPVLKLSTKNHKTRKVPIVGKIKTYLKFYCSSLSGEQLFFTAGKKYMTKSSYDKMWQRIVKAMRDAGSNSTRLTAHMFRHNYCTNLCYQIPTVSIKMIAELLGDTEKMVLEVYNHVILEKEDSVEAVRKALSI